MSLYNSLFGSNENAGILLELLQINPANIPRFRDCYFDNDKNRIVIHTRTGGGNRDYYENIESCKSNYPEYFGNGDDPKGPWNDDLRSHPLYDRDEDSSFDSTYADFYFKLPTEIDEEIKKYLDESSQCLKPTEKWEKLFEILGKNHD